MHAQCHVTLEFHPDRCVLFGMLVCRVCACVCVCAHMRLQEQSINGYMSISLGHLPSRGVRSITLIANMILLGLPF